MALNKKILEQDVKLSESILWKYQNEAYQQFGPEAWVTKGVPSYLTSNPYTVRQYVLQFIAYLRDCTAPYAATPIDFSEPIYIFDLGAGTGRFGYLFLKMFHEMVSGLELKKLKIHYIMTDIVESNLAFCQQHPFLKQFIDAEILDFAKFKHSDKKINLILSKKELVKNVIKNPLVLIANYFFDTIPQDLFRIKSNVLEEGLCTVFIDDFEETNQSSLDPSLIKKLKVRYSYNPIDMEEYYSNIFFKEVLKEYYAKFDNTTFLFPVGACECLDFFSELSSNRFLLLAGDQGFVTEAQIKTTEEPEIAMHGSFSIAVDYHALAAFLRIKNGYGLLTSFPDKQFVVISGIVGGSKTQYPETCLAFKQSFDYFEPVDYWKLVNIWDSNEKGNSLEALLLIIKLGNWDPVNFHHFFERIQNEIISATQELKNALGKVINRVLENTYPISKDEGHFILNLGVLCYQIERYEQAIYLFEKSLIFTGPQKQTYINLSSCYLALKDLEKAKFFFRKAEVLSS